MWKKKFRVEKRYSEHEELIRDSEIPKLVRSLDYAHLLPTEIHQFTGGGIYSSNSGEELLSFTQGAGHEGPHPHMVQEFVSSLIEGRDPWPNAKQSANWTCAGILAHESALKGGEIKNLAEETLS